MAITDWPLGQRPREKLLQQGAKSLTDAELLAIFLRTGTKGKTAVELATRLMTDLRSLKTIFELKQEDFCQYIGLGQAKYVQLKACLEMVRRYLYADLHKPQPLKDFSDMAAFLMSQLRYQEREIFSALFLDRQYRVIAYEELFSGGLREVVVHPRELVKKALAFNSVNVIVAHNHPSGWIFPSKADKQLTQRLKTTLLSVEIVLLDHMIIGEGKIFSFSEKGLL